MLKAFSCFNQGYKNSKVSKVHARIKDTCHLGIARDLDLKSCCTSMDYGDFICQTYYIRNSNQYRASTFVKATGQGRLL
jgi:hypothetical protein